MSTITHHFQRITNPNKPRSAPATRAANSNSAHAKNEPFPELTLIDASRQAFQAHLNLISYEGGRFDHEDALQAQEFALFSRLELYIPREKHRPAQSKLVISKSHSHDVSEEDEGYDNNGYRRITRVFQCMSGIEDHLPIPEVTTSELPSTASSDSISNDGKALPSKHGTPKKAPKKRQRTLNYVGCCFCVQLMSTHLVTDKGKNLQFIDEITGIFDHNEECEKLEMMPGKPRIPLHPELWDFTISCVQNDHMSPQQLAKRCNEWAQAKWGKNYSSGDKSFCFQLTSHDRTSIYRTIAAGTGVPQRSAAETNLDLWFRTDFPSPPSPILQQSLLHYEAFIKDESEHFVLILGHPEEQEFACSVAHNGQVDFDLTFGFSSARALLMNIVAIDHRDNSGILIGHIIFTAHPTAKATHADYNTVLLTRLIRLFKEKLSERLGIKFTVCIVNTDNDPRECAALSSTWRSVHLLLCMFHIWQAWHNKLRTCLQSILPGEACTATRSNLAQFSMQLMKETKTYLGAIAEYNKILGHYQQLEQQSDEISKKQARAGLAYLAYFRGYLKDLAFWKAWSPAGAAEAATKLGIPVEKVACMTNHVEYFNHLLKGPLFAVYEKGGRHPRLDI